MKKGVVMEVKKNEYLLMFTETGGFEKGRYKDCQVGEEVYFKPIVKRNLKKYSFLQRNVAVLAAVCLLVFTLLSTNSAGVAYASVHIDINPHIEMKINKDRRVLQLKPHNQKGKLIVERLSRWKFMPMGKVMGLIIEESRKQGYMDSDNDVVLLSTTFEEDSNDDNEDRKKVQDSIKRDIAVASDELGENDNLEIHSVEVSGAIVEEAKREGVSPAKFALITAIGKMDESVERDDLKDKSIEELQDKVGSIEEAIGEEINDEKWSSLKRLYLSALKERRNKSIETSTKEVINDSKESYKESKFSTIGNNKNESLSNSDRESNLGQAGEHQILQGQDKSLIINEIIQKTGTVNNLLIEKVSKVSQSQSKVGFEEVDKPSKNSREMNDQKPMVSNKKFVSNISKTEVAERSEVSEKPKKSTMNVKKEEKSKPQKHDSIKMHSSKQSSAKNSGGNHSKITAMKKLEGDKSNSKEYLEKPSNGEKDNKNNKITSPKKEKDKGNQESSEKVQADVNEEFDTPYGKKENQIDKKSHTNEDEVEDADTKKSPEEDEIIAHNAEKSSEKQVNQEIEDVEIKQESKAAGLGREGSKEIEKKPLKNPDEVNDQVSLELNFKKEEIQGIENDVATPSTKNANLKENKPKHDKEPPEKIETNKSKSNAETPEKGEEKEVIEVKEVERGNNEA